MSTIDEKVQQIRSAIYGKDVREAIASGIEDIYAVAMSAREDITNYLKEAIAINEAAVLATDKANTAATNANTAAQEAELQASIAKTAADRANEAADNAHTILQGSNDPSAELGKNGDFYINTSIDSYHLFYKQNDVWEDQGTLKGVDGSNKVLVGDSIDSAVSKELFIQTITQAQAIAETRGITVNEYDARLPMNQVRVSNEINSQGLDEFLKSVNHRYKVDNGDLNEITAPGEYECTGCANTPEGAVILNVSVFTSSIVQIASKPNSINMYKRYFTGGTWSGWRLIAGELVIWEGAASGIMDISISRDIDMFGSLQAIVGGYSVQAPIIKGYSKIMFAGSFVQADNTAYQLSAYMTIKNNLVLTNFYSPMLICIKNGVYPTISTTNVSKIIGRP